MFGGIHFHEGNLVGLKVGREVGVQVWNKAVTLFNDPAHTPFRHSHLSEHRVSRAVVTDQSGGTD